MPEPIKDHELECVQANIWQANVGSWASIIKWGRDHQRSIHHIMNAIIPLIWHCMLNYTTADVDGNPVVEMNFGKVTIKKPTRHGLPWMINRKKSNQSPSSQTSSD